MIKRLLLAITLFSLVACTAQQQKEYIKIRGFTQGTSYHITYYSPEEKNLSPEIDVLLERVDSSMSVYRKNSVINAFNNSSKGYLLDTLLANIVMLSQQFNTETDGAFDITLGPLVDAWGFHAKRGEMPHAHTIEQLKIATGANMIELNDLYLSKKHPGVMIDVNAIAPGYTVDVISDYLEQQCITDYLVELGGEIRTAGKSPRNTKWLVGIDKPIENSISGEDLQVIIELSNEALVTSGNYRKFFVRDGVKYSHTIDPKTGYPVRHSLLSATVIDKKSARADALATAFMVMGVEKSKEWLSRNSGVEAYLISSNTEGEYEIWMTEGLQERIKD
ncbi:MAG: FAD:protein FMN transferase [Tenuifilaceae bacterium]|nr:FAD:protein FMN transferase [Tenuifilaceae bacterium]